MKQNLTSLTFLLLILLISSCSNESNFQYDGRLFIEGKILNFEKHLEFKKFNLYHHNLIEIQIIETVEIKDDGTFNISIPCHAKMDFFIAIGRVPAYLICVPNDSLFLTIDVDVINDPMNHFPNGSYFAKVTGGTRVKDNQFVNEFIERTQNNLGRVEYFNIIETLSPIEYLDYQNNLEEMKMLVLDSMLQSTKADIFESWAKDFSKYSKIDRLLKYPDTHARLNNVSVDSVDIPEEYFAKIFNEDINDTKIFSFYHSAFFSTYYAYLYKKAEKNGIDLIEYIKDNTSGFSKDMALVKYFYSLNQKSDSLAEINSELITNKYLKNLLTGEINEQEKKKVELLKIKTHSTLIDSLFGKYKDSVVYVDFWATWCGPCMQEIPWSIELIEKFKDKPMVFLFLCNQSKYEDWQKMVKEKELKGTHVFLNDNEFNELRTLFNINGIPHYLLINKQGVIMNDAPRPSNKNIDSEIQKLLNE